jgi:phosphotransferase system  glucose/maltose/N-acetylglucosamine-specific IIC component
VPNKQPNAVIRLAANALVSVLVAWIVTKVFGRRAGLGAAVIGVIAHELLNKPIANALSELVQ